MKMKRAAQKIKMIVKHLSILAYMELALIQKVVLIALAMKGGRRKKMKTSVLRTLTNASLTILVYMELATILRVVSYATVTQAGKRKKEVFTLLLAHICPIMIRINFFASPAIIRTYKIAHSIL